MTLETRDAPATSPPDGAIESDERAGSAASDKRPIRLGALPGVAFGWLRAAAPALLLGVAILALWQLVTASRVIPAYDLPAPGDVLRAWLRGVGLSGASSHTTPQLLSYGLTTLMESVAGFLLGTAIAIPLGYGIARSQMLARALQPYMAAMQALPAIALAPLLTLWLG